MSGENYKATATQGGTVVAVGTSTTQVWAGNGSVSTVILQNDHATQAVYLKLGTAAAVANSGIRLLPAAGNTITLENYGGAIQGISVGGSSNVLLTVI